MNWTEIMKVGFPAAVGAASAILSAWLTHIFAERRHRREMLTKNREMRQRLLESLIPQRIHAYQEVFILLNRLKSDTVEISEVLEEMTPHLLWIDSSLAIGIVDCLKASRKKQEFYHDLATLQDRLRKIAGVVSLEQYFADTTTLGKEN